MSSSGQKGQATQTNSSLLAQQGKPCVFSASFGVMHFAEGPQIQRLGEVMVAIGHAINHCRSTTTAQLLLVAEGELDDEMSVRVRTSLFNYLHSVLDVLRVGDERFSPEGGTIQGQNSQFFVTITRRPA